MTSDGSESASSLKETDSSTRGKYEDEESPASFSILLRTSCDSSSDDPTGRISFLIRDDEGRATDKQTLRFSHTHPTPFQKGHTDLFVMSNQPSLGPLAFCEIHYNPKDEAGKWEHHQVQVFHHENGRLYNFVADEKQSNETVSVMVCRDDGVQILPNELRNPFK